MGSAMAILIWLVIIAAAAWFLAGGGLAALSGGRKRADDLPAEDALRYVVPEGQDPAAIVALLAPKGYVTKLEEPGHERVLVINTEDDGRPDRTVVRALIAEANTTIQDPVLMATDVRFADEVG